MSVTTTRQFLAILGRSNLLTPEQIRTATNFCSKRPEPKAIARQLVQEGWLTRWQAQQLLAGRSKLYLGKYKLLEKIGQGGMGAVFKAEQPGFNRIVALKLMTMGLFVDAETIARFVREIQLAAALQHPHIVAAYDADCVRNTYFLVMEYVEGHDLKDWIERNALLPVEWSCEVARQTALGLQYGHEHGLVHRDIKPANLLIVRQPDDVGLSGLAKVPLAKLLDFGLAKFVSETQEEGGLTKTGQIMGTPDYMAPEQAEDTQNADIRSDIYSLGCTLFHMITGDPPFSGKSAMEKLLARAKQDAPRLGSRAPGVPRELDILVARMLARDPADRFQTPQEVADALAPFALSTMAEPPGDSVVLTPAPRQKPGKVEARADDTLNRFLNQMSDHPADSTPKSPRKGSSANLGSPTRIAAYGFYGAASFLLLVGLIWFISRGQSDPSQDESIAKAPPKKSSQETPFTKEAPLPLPSEIGVSIAPKGGFALSFDGIDDYIEIPTLTKGLRSPLTVEITLTPLSAPLPIVFAGHSAEGDIVFLKIFEQRFSIGAGKLSGGEFGVESLRPTDLVEWEEPIHVAAVFGDGPPRIYVNGTFARGEVAKDANSAGTSDPPGFRIGKSPAGIASQSVPYRGLIDEVRISNKARYIQNYQPKDYLETDEHTIALYHFNEGQGDQLTDSSGNGHHGKIHGASWVSTEPPDEPVDPLQPPVN